MTRRAALRRAMLLITAASIVSETKVMYGQRGGTLRVPLDQWHDVTFEYKGERVVVSSAEIFAAIQSGATH